MSDLRNIFYIEVERRQREDRMREETTNSLIQQIAEEFRRERKNRKQSNKN
jgi:hypothetical protein